MGKILKIFATTAIVILLFNFFSACKTDKLPEPQQPTFCDSITATYTASVKDILDAKCATGGCHLNSQSPILSDFTQVFGNKERISVRALDLKTMPPMGMPQLTEAEIKILTCWKEAAYPE
jgi:uncharacterized membrane protein